MKLRRTVIVDGARYAGGSTPPADVARRITNPKAWEAGATPTPAAEEMSPEEPPRAGPGSGTVAWRAYAEAIGVGVPDDAGRDDIIAAVDNR